MGSDKKELAYDRAIREVQHFERQRQKALRKIAQHEAEQELKGHSGNKLPIEEVIGRVNSNRSIDLTPTDEERAIAFGRIKMLPVSTLEESKIRSIPEYLRKPATKICKKSHEDHKKWINLFPMTHYPQIPQSTDNLASRLYDPIDPNKPHPSPVANLLRIPFSSRSAEQGFQKGMSALESGVEKGKRLYDDTKDLVNGWKENFDVRIGLGFQGLDKDHQYGQINEKSSSSPSDRREPQVAHQVKKTPTITLGAGLGSPGPYGNFGDLGKAINEHATILGKGPKDWGNLFNYIASFLDNRIDPNYVRKTWDGIFQGSMGEKEKREILNRRSSFGLGYPPKTRQFIKTMKEPDLFDSYYGSHGDTNPMLGPIEVQVDSPYPPKRLITVPGLGSITANELYLGLKVPMDFNAMLMPDGNGKGYLKMLRPAGNRMRHLGTKTERYLRRYLPF